MIEIVDSKHMGRVHVGRWLERGEGVIGRGGAEREG